MCVIGPSALVALVMFLCAIVTGRMAGVSSAGLFLDYMPVTAFVSALVAAAYGLWWRNQIRWERPGYARWQPRKLRERATYMTLPAVIMPFFTASFTGAKTAIHRLVGYGWDSRFAATDHMIFGVDPWILTHAILGRTASIALEYVYVGWGGVIVIVATLVALMAKPAFVARFCFAMILTWFLAGFVLAYAFSAAGPVFVHSIHGSSSFMPLIRHLDALLGPDSPIRHTQNYLLGALDSPLAVKGGGISAMPSVHVAASAVLLLAAWRGPLRWPAFLFFAAICVGSVHFGYHYGVDGVAGLAVAVFAWLAAGQLKLCSACNGRGQTDDDHSAVPAAQPLAQAH